MTQMVGAFAEFARAILRERIKAGLDAARKEGRIGGRRPISNDQNPGAETPDRQPCSSSAGYPRSCPRFPGRLEVENKDEERPARSRGQVQRSDHTGIPRPQPPGNG
jgi:hypothetical protein